MVGKTNLFTLPDMMSTKTTPPNPTDKKVNGKVLTVHEMQACGMVRFIWTHS